MGVMRFVIHPPELLDEWPEGERAYISGADGRVFPTRVEREQETGVIACRRNYPDSGKMYVAWSIPGFGRPVIGTTALSEREEPYLLNVELARGKISQLRDQLGAWELEGFSPPEEFTALYKQAHDLFRDASANQDDVERASNSADEALQVACRAAECLVQAHVQRELESFRAQSPGLPASLGCNLGGSVPEGEWSRRFCEAFTSACVPIEWRHIEPVEGEYDWDLNDRQVDWCLDNRMLTCGGPLLDLSPDGLPLWLRQWEHDFLNLQSFVCDFVETAISRYVGKIRHWIVASHVNTGGGLSLSEENRLSLIARALDVARQADEEIQLIVRVDQPWGEYQAHGLHYLSPLQFVDALLRSGIGLAAVELEIAAGFQRRGTALRDVLEVSRLIDLWSALGVPLQVLLAFPSAEGADPAACSSLEVDGSQWRDPLSPAAQAAWLGLYLPLLMSKSAVVGVSWSQFSDRTRHDFPHAGLVGRDGTLHPAFERIVEHRRTYGKSGDVLTTHTN